MTVRSALFVVLLVLVCAACDSQAPVDFEEQVVVEGYLAAGEGFGSIRLSRTAPLNSTYDFETLALSGATVRVQLLSDGGEVERTYSYLESEVRPGIYVAFTADFVLPGRTYRLEALAPGVSAPISAQTTVPASLQVLNISSDTLVYQGADQLEVDIAPDPAGPEQRVFAFSTRAQDVRVENLTPFAAALYEEGDLELEDLSTGSSPLLNEANYEITTDGAIRIRMPWLAISFFGPNRLTITSVDKNYYDFRRTADVQQGGTTLAPGEIPNVLEHVEGGTGMFASYARVSTLLYVARPGEAAGGG